MDDIFDENGVRTYFVTERLRDLRDDIEYVHIDARKEGLPFVIRRRVRADAAGDPEVLGLIGADMHVMLGLAEEASKNGTLAPLCEVEDIDLPTEFFLLNPFFLFLTP